MRLSQNSANFTNPQIWQPETKWKQNLVVCIHRTQTSDTKLHWPERSQNSPNWCMPLLLTTPSNLDPSSTSAMTYSASQLTSCALKPFHLHHAHAHPHSVSFPITKSNNSISSQNSRKQQSLKTPVDDVKQTPCMDILSSATESCANTITQSIASPWISHNKCFVAMTMQILRQQQQVQQHPGHCVISIFLFFVYVHEWKDLK